MPQYDEILSRVSGHLRAMVPAETQLTENSDLIDELGLDSVLVMDLVLEIEDEFDVSVPVNVLADVRTLRDLTLAIQRLIEEN